MNNKPVEFYQPELARLKIQEPLELAGKHSNRVDINISVKGGGAGQAEASRTAIARGIVEWSGDENYRNYFKTTIWLVNDTRRKEQSTLWVAELARRGKNHTGEKK